MRRLWSLVLASVAAQLVLAAPIKLDLDRSKSYIVAVTRKGGLLSFAGGHEHGILATEWSAAVCFDRDNPPASSVRIVVPTKSLRIDSEEARQKVKLPAKGPGPKDVEEIQGKMLGPGNLSAEQHAEIEFKTASVEKKGLDALVLTGPLTIRGRTRTVSALVTLGSLAADSLLFTGELKVKQTDFGIKPASVAGVVNVKDLVEIRFEFQARPTTESCK